MSGEKSLSVRNWFPGAWYVRDKRELTRRVVRLYFQNESGGFTKIGKVRTFVHPCSYLLPANAQSRQILSCAPVPGQPLLVALRLDQGKKFNVRDTMGLMIVFASCACLTGLKCFTGACAKDGVSTCHGVSGCGANAVRPARGPSGCVPIVHSQSHTALLSTHLYLTRMLGSGVVSTDTVVELINKICGAVHLKELTKHDMVRRVFDLLVDGAETVEQDQLVVRRM